MVKNKNFTSGDEAVGKFFEQKSIEETAKNTEDTKNTHVTNDTNIGQNTPNTQIMYNDNITNDSKPTNKSKHYNERGKRGQRFGLLIDEKLKEDLKHLSMATGSKSINDFIVTILLEHVESKENQIKLEQYRKLLQD